MSEYISLEDAAELIGTGRPRVRNLLQAQRIEGKKAMGKKGHIAWMLVNRASAIEYMKKRRDSWRNRAMCKKAQPRCPRCYILVAHEGNLCSMCQAELAGQRYYQYRPIELTPSSWPL